MDEKAAEQLAVVAGVLFVLLVICVLAALHLRKQQRQLRAGPSFDQVVRNAETTLAGFAGRVGGAFYGPQPAGWGLKSAAGVRFRCHDLHADLTYAWIQGSSYNERVVLPFLVLEPPAGATWRCSPADAISAALAANGHAARRIHAHRSGFAVYLEPPETRRGGHVVAPLVESVIGVDTLIQMVEVASRAARTTVTTST